MADPVDISFWDPLEDPFNTAGFLWEFDPIALTQRRPTPQDHDGWIAGRLYEKPSLDHERAHWFQFAGTTIGSLVLTLTRSEDQFARMLLSDPDPQIKTFVKNRLIDRSATLADIWMDSRSLVSKLGNLLRFLIEARLAKFMILNGDLPVWAAIDNPSTLLADALKYADRVYAAHTGNRRPWALLEIPARYFSPQEIGTCEVDGHQLTTRHLFESSAVINELGPLLMSAWGGIRGLQNRKPFTSLPRDEEAEVLDRLRRLTPRYSLALKYALSKWQAHFGPSVAENEAQKIALAAPALACCFDIAFNPAVVPMSQPDRSPLLWSDLFPPLRFLAAVKSVAALGRFPGWTGNEDYLTYRSSVAEGASLLLGATTHRSFQNPELNGSFFKNAEWSNDTLLKTSYFDYLIWSMETLQLGNERRPLLSANPWMFMLNIFPDADIMRFMASDDHCCAGAPLYWVGNKGGTHIAHSRAFSQRLILDLCVNYINREIVVGTGPIDLGRHFGPATLTEDLFAVSLQQVQALVDLPEIRGLEVLGPESDHQVVPAATNTLLFNGGAEIIYHTITREEVEDLDLSRLRTVMVGLCDDIARNARCLDFRFTGWRADDRELWDIPEVTAFVRAYVDAFPEWPWFISADLNPLKSTAQLLIFLSFFENPRRLESDLTMKWLTHSFNVINFMCDFAGLDQTTNEKMSKDLDVLVKSFWVMRLL